MKITFEFDTLSEDFQPSELERFKAADDLAFCICKIKEQLRQWYKYDSRGNIPFDEVYDRLFDIIIENVNMEKMGY